jgi:transcriptional antiterminator NusG
VLKASDNPPLVWPQEKSVIDFVGTWWVAHTKSRNEKSVAHALLSKDVQYFLPMTWKVHCTRGRKFKSLLPLFPGYLFFCGDEQSRLEALRTNKVANIIEVKSTKRFTDELLQIEHALKSGAKLEPHKYLKAGQLCRVISGPLIGMQGIVVKTKGAAHLILNIEMLGQAASLEIESDLIETVES